MYLNKQQSYDITSQACTLVTFSTWHQKKNNGCEKHSKLETKYDMEVATQDVDLKYHHMAAFWIQSDL